MLKKKIFGTGDRPRFSVYRSLNQIYAQIIDDEKNQTLVSASTLDPELKDICEKKNKKESAKMVGELIAKKALCAGIKKVAFDRGESRYHGRILALADGARAAGLEF